MGFCSSSSSAKMAMATPLITLLLLIVCLVSLGKGHPLKICQFDKIYQFGDSYADAGNLVKEIPNSPSARLPYGESIILFYKNSTGRFSDGELMMDRIADAAGLWPPAPYKNNGSDFGQGVNFAVAGATALSEDVLADQHNITSHITNSSLDVQMNWMMTHLDSLCHDHDDGIGSRGDCAEKLLRTALFMVGQIGMTDYTYALFQGKTMEQVRSMVPQVVGAIINATRMLINVGAETLVVPGIFPIGCLPLYKTYFENNTAAAGAAYDEDHCLGHLNDFAIYHNQQLNEAINKFNQEERPNAVVVYGDHYNAYKNLLLDAKALGHNTEVACCGTGGKYNFDMTKMCGSPDVQACYMPNLYVSWDGIHLTQEAYTTMAGWFIGHDMLPKLHCSIEDFSAWNFYGRRG